VRQLSAAGAIQITASHNPAPWNGLKMFGPDGAVLPGDRGKQVQQVFESGGLKYATWDRIGVVRVPPDVLEDHARLACEAIVVAGMRAHNAVIGGEGNGGVIDPRIGWVRDPFVGMAMILNLMADGGRPLSELVGALPAYAMLKTKVTVPKEKLAAGLAAI